MTAVLTALGQHAPMLEIGDPVRQINNTIRSLASLPVILA